MKRDIKDFVSQKGFLNTTLNKLPGFLDAQKAHLFVMYAKAIFQIKFEQTMSFNGANLSFDNFYLNQCLISFSY
jgi:hypothetical protein